MEPVIYLFGSNIIANTTELELVSSTGRSSRLISNVFLWTILMGGLFCPVCSTYLVVCQRSVHRWILLPQEGGWWLHRPPKLKRYRTTGTDRETTRRRLSSSANSLRLQPFHGEVNAHRSNRLSTRWRFKCISFEQRTQSNTNIHYAYVIHVHIWSFIVAEGSSQRLTYYYNYPYHYFSKIRARCIESLLLLHKFASINHYYDSDNYYEGRNGRFLWIASFIDDTYTNLFTRMSGSLIWD